VDIVDLLAAMDKHQTEALARHEALLAKMDERLAQMDARAAERAVQHEALLAKMDDRLAQQDQILERLTVMIDHAREDAIATRQMTTLAMQRFTDTRLDVDRFIATAERVLAAWERQGR